MKKKKNPPVLKARPFPISPMLMLALVLVVIATLLTDPLLAKIKTYVNYSRGNNLESSEYVNFIKNQTGKFDKNAKIAIFLNKNVPLPKAPVVEEAMVLGDQTVNDSKWIEINLSQQRLYMHDGGNVTSFLVSTGKWDLTPTGTYRTYVKYRYTRMSGGSGASYYNLPNVPYTMYFYKGYGIHGTYWHNNFGTPMSHGCINMKTEEAGIVYNWAPVGTKVVIHY